MASPLPSNRGHTNEKAVVISGALQLAKQVVMTQLQDIDPIVLHGIKESFARLEEEALEACLPVSPPPASLPPASFPLAPASDQPNQIPCQEAESGSEGLVHPAEKGSSTVSQGGEAAQPLRDDNEVMKGVVPSHIGPATVDPTGANAAFVEGQGRL